MAYPCEALFLLCAASLLGFASSSDNSELVQLGLAKDKMIDVSWSKWLEAEAAPPLASKPYLERYHHSTTIVPPPASKPSLEPATPRIQKAATPAAPRPPKAVTEAAGGMFLAGGHGRTEDPAASFFCRVGEDDCEFAGQAEDGYFRSTDDSQDPDETSMCSLEVTTGIATEVEHCAQQCLDLNPKLQTGACYGFSFDEKASDCLLYNFPEEKYQETGYPCTFTKNSEDDTVEVDFYKRSQVTKVTILTPCTCANGSPAFGEACTEVDANICTMCDEGFEKAGDECLAPAAAFRRAHELRQERAAAPTTTTPVATPNADNTPAALHRESPEAPPQTVMTEQEPPRDGPPIIPDMTQSVNNNIDNADTPLQALLREQVLKRTAPENPSLGADSKNLDADNKNIAPKAEEQKGVDLVSKDDVEIVKANAHAEVNTAADIAKMLDQRLGR